MALPDILIARRTVTSPDKRHAADTMFKGLRVIAISAAAQRLGGALRLALDVDFTDQIQPTALQHVGL